MHSLSIIVPAYNEQDNIEAGKLEEIASWLRTYPAPVELIVVDDGSGDNTIKLAESTATRAISIPHSGKAAALMKGMMTAVHDHILFCDLDQATPISEAAKLLPFLEQSADIVIGSRGLHRQHAPVSRYILSLGHTLLRRLMLRLSIRDTQCGFKACKRKAALEILDHLKIYDPKSRQPVKGSRVNSGFDVEFLLVGFHLGYTIIEVPVKWNYQRTRCTNLFREVYGGWRDLISIARENFNGNYRRNKKAGWKS